MSSMPLPTRTSFRWIVPFLVTALLLSGCSGGFFGKKEPAPPPVQPKVTGLPATVPDYVVSSDANVTKRTEDEKTLTVEMESINGVTSPIAYYKRMLPEKKWEILSDTTTDRGGAIVATKMGKQITVSFGSLKTGGSTIVITMEK